MNVLEKVQEIVADHLGVAIEEVVPAAKIKDDLGADSLDLVELVMNLEEAFKLRIPEEDLQKISTIQDVVDYIGQRA